MDNILRMSHLIGIVVANRWSAIVPRKKKEKLGSALEWDLAGELWCSFTEAPLHKKHKADKAA